MSTKEKLCDECRFGHRHYAEGYILKNFTKSTQDPKELPDPTAEGPYWTYLECEKNSKGLRFINLDGKCMVFSPKK